MSSQRPTRPTSSSSPVRELKDGESRRGFPPSMSWTTRLVHRTLHFTQFGSISHFRSLSLFSSLPPHKLKKDHPGVATKVGKLPEKTVFKRLAPGVIDERKVCFLCFSHSLVACPTASTSTHFVLSGRAGILSPKFDSQCPKLAQTG